MLNEDRMDKHNEVIGINSKIKKVQKTYHQK